MDPSFTTTTDLPPLQEHPVYREGMVQINAGQWHEAYGSFQMLAGVYPNNVEVKDVLKEVQMRATMVAVQPRPRSRRSKGHTLRWLVVGVGLLLIIGLAGYAIYEFWIRPVLIHELRVRQVTTLRNEADEAIAAGDYAQARLALEELQEIMPDDPETMEILGKAKQAEKLATLYGEARVHLAAGEWDQAIEVMTELHSLDAQYRDLPQLLKAATESQSLEKQFQTAEVAFKNGDWETAIGQFETLQETNLTFKFEEVETRLFESHLRYGESLLKSVGTDPEKVAESLAHIQAALILRPMDAAALNERRLAETYLAALNSTHQKEKIELLQTIQSERPNYAGQTSAQLLYTLLVERADLLLESGDKTAALADYQNAVQLPVEDFSVAQQKLAELASSDSP